MAIPRVFISSTCYDLKYIRENLSYFIKEMGYEPILSEDGDVFYSPASHTHDSCLVEIGTCNLFILIIGGRFGGKFKDDERSITNAEFSMAVRLNIPTFVLIESSVLQEHLMYAKNDKAKLADINFPSVDDIKIFDFIDEARKRATNNAYAPFSDFADIRMYLKKQWAGMMYDYLQLQQKSKEQQETKSLLKEIKIIGEKTEEILKKLYSSSDENAQIEIDNIELEAKAKAFLEKINSLFENPYYYDIEYTLDVLPIYWWEFLTKNGSFEFPANIDFDNTMRGTYISYKNYYFWEIYSYSGELTQIAKDIQSFYEAFRLMPKDKRIKLVEDVLDTIPF
jgi:hypothetical protein